MSWSLPSRPGRSHLNSFRLGQHGRYRTNVWQYRGVNTLKAGRMDELMLHPTVKPVQMIADAIKDVSRRNGIVLDSFAGSGSTLIAAHKCGRRGYLIELDPRSILQSSVSNHLSPRSIVLRHFEVARGCGGPCHPLNRTPIGNPTVIPLPRCPAAGQCLTKV